MSGPGISGPSCPLSPVDNVVPRERLQIPALPKGTEVYFTSHRREGLSLLVYSLLFEAEAQGTMVPILRRLGVLGMLSCLLTLTVTHGSAPMGHGHTVSLVHVTGTVGPESRGNGFTQKGRFQMKHEG